MDAARRRRWAITAGAAVLLVAGVWFYYSSVEPEAPDDRSFSVNSVDTSSLECPRNDLIYVHQPQVADTTLPSSTSQAIQTQVTETYEEITPAALDTVDSSATSSTFQYSAEGATLAEVELSNAGDGWRLESFAACNSFLKDQVPGTPR